MAQGHALRLEEIFSRLDLLEAKLAGGRILMGPEEQAAFLDRVTDVVQQALDYTKVAVEGIQERVAALEAKAADEEHSCDHRYLPAQIAPYEKISGDDDKKYDRQRLFQIYVCERCTDPKEVLVRDARPAKKKAGE